MKHYAMRFISGKYQGGEFPLPGNSEVVVGRSSDLDMVLVEDMVSRRHAKISVNGDNVTIQDLGSTNGTFVNGERVKRATLNDGDRVLIGTSIIKLVATDGPAAPAQAPKKLEEVRQRHFIDRARHAANLVGSASLGNLLDLLRSGRS